MNFSAPLGQSGGVRGGLAVLDVLREERLPENALRVGIIY